MRERESPKQSQHGTRRGRPHALRRPARVVPSEAWIHGEGAKSGRSSVAADAAAPPHACVTECKRAAAQRGASFSGAVSRRAASIRDRRDLAHEVRVLQFVHEGDGVVLGGNAAVTLRVGDQRVRARAERAGTLARGDQRGGREEGPVEIRHRAVKSECLAVRERDRLVGVREAVRIHQLLAGRDFERARAAHHHEARQAGGARAVDQRAARDLQIAQLARRRRIGARHHVMAAHRRRHARGIEQIGLRGLYVRAGDDALRLAHQRADLMATACRFGGDARTHHAGGAKKRDFQGLAHVRLLSEVKAFM
ncbi:hypothetical protein PT2222_240029 [Paraburkholderia tropica]